MSENSNERIYAPLKKRIFAFLVDILVFCVVFFPTMYLVKGVWIMSPIDHQWAYGLFITDPLCIMFLFIMVAYFVLLEAFFGQTIGKMLIGIKVVADDGLNPGLRRSIIRNILRVVDSLPMFSIYGIYLIQKTPKRSRFGDIKAGTIVIVKKKEKKLK